MEKRIPVLISADSVCDLPRELIEQYHIAINPYLVQTKEGQFIDGQEIDADDLMIYMRDDGRQAKSEPPQVSAYADFFKEQLLIADKIIHITMGENASEGYARAVEAAGEFANVTVVDSGQLSSGMGLLVLRAAKLAEAGYGKTHILRELERVKKAVSTSFVVQNTEFMYRAGRLPKAAKNVCDRLLLHPVLCMKKSAITVKGIWVGQWKNVMQKYIRETLKNVWRIDRDILFITHVNLSAEELEFLRDEVMARCPFKQIYFQKASSAIACNCGEGSFGFLFMHKVREPRPEHAGEHGSMVARLKNAVSRFSSVVLRDEYSIQQKMMNLIFTAALIGAAVSMVVMLAVQAWASAAVSGLMLLIVGLAMYISIVRNNVKLAGLLICFLANMVLFPLMFFTSGGIDSGMPIWFVLGLVFDFLILKGWTSIGMIAANLLMMVGCIVAAEHNPSLLTATPEGYQMMDVIQSIIVIACILGVILKYQTHVYEEQRRKLEEHEKELLAANRAKSKFLANMSHEIRTPINGIIGMNTMMLRECADNPTLTEYGVNIQSASQSLLAIINDILDISKIESGKLEIIPGEYELFSVVNDCYNMTASRAMNKGLEFMIHMNPNLPSALVGDEVRVRQIINNLLSNAVKYTDEGMVELTLDYERKSDASIVLTVEVRDTGIGVRKEDIGKLFESFTRVDEKRNSNVEGTGLGLNLTKKLVDLMHGEIGVTSVYNQGSVFTAKLPQIVKSWEPVGDFAVRYQELLSQQDKLSEVVYAPDASVLVVDDVPMNLLVARGLLKYTGITVDTANGGAEALELIAKNKYDIIFLDHLMPEMDGVECLHRFREMSNHPNMNTPIIVLTANAIMGAREEYIQAGFTDYLAKPIQERELQSMLMKYLPQELVTLRSMDELVRAAKDKKQSASASVEPASAPEADLSDMPIIDRLSSIDGLDTATGLGYCMDDEDFYEEMLKEYLNSDKKEAMAQYFEAQDWENYRITVHALKSTSLTIGAAELSEQAKALEFACKENNPAYVQDNHAQVLERYDKFLGALRQALGV